MEELRKFIIFEKCKGFIKLLLWVIILFSFSLVIFSSLLSILNIR